MKKVISLILCAILVTISLCGCVRTDTGADTGSDFQSSILLCGSTSLYPIISSLASSFTETYATWDMVDPAFPKKNISVYVAPGGSGVGAAAAIDRTADFGMLARAVRDSEKAALGAGYKEFIVARDALTISVNAQNPYCGLTDSMDTVTIRKVFSGEITTWDQLDPTLPSKAINVYIRDLSGGANEVFQNAVMGGEEITPNASQTASMTELAASIANDPWSIGYVGFGAYSKINADSPVIFSMKVDGVEATSENILNDTYRIQRPVMLITGDAISPAEQKFLDYIFSQVGYDVIQANGYIPAFTL